MSFCSHVAAWQIYKMWELGQSIETDLNTEVQFEISFAHRIINVTMYLALDLAQNKFAFRGHKESLA